MAKEQIKDMIASILKGENLVAENTFNDEVIAKIANIVESKRQEIVGGLFKEESDEPSSSASVKDWAAKKAKQDIEKARAKKNAALDSAKKDLEADDEVRKNSPKKILKYLYAKKK